MLLEEVSKALGCILGKSDVLVNVEGVDAVPRDLLVGGKGVQNLVLRGGGGKDHVNGLFLLQKGKNARLNIRACGLAHFVSGIVNIDL